MLVILDEPWGREAVDLGEEIVFEDLDVLLFEDDRDGDDHGKISGWPLIVVLHGQDGLGALAHHDDLCGVVEHLLVCPSHVETAERCGLRGNEHGEKYNSQEGRRGGCFHAKSPVWRRDAPPGMVSGIRSPRLGPGNPGATWVAHGVERAGGARRSIATQSQTSWRHDGARAIEVSSALDFDCVGLPPCPKVMSYKQSSGAFPVHPKPMSRRSR